MTEDVLVSVVMPSYNQAEFIGRSIDSVLQQSYAPIELIVADGASTDGTLETLKQKAEQYSGLRWSSGPDSGPAEAINSALSKARGLIVGWLNSDDLYAPGAVSRAVAALKANPDWIMCYGQGEHVDAEGARLGAYPTQSPDVGIEAFVHGCFICQPSVFFKTSMTSLIGQLDEGLKTSFDYDLWLRAFQEFPERIGFIDALQAQSRLHDGCITQNMRRTVAIEGVQLARKYLGQGAPHWIATYLENISPQMREEDGEEAFLAHAGELIDELATCFDPDQLKYLRNAFGTSG